MVKIYKVILVSFFIIFFIGCSSNSTSIEDEILNQYKQGLKYYNNKKYSKARESFEYVITRSAGSRLALESEFYLAESLYNLKEYMDALYNYDNYARSSQDLELIELSRFRICNCVYSLSADYKNDQSTTLNAISKIDMFLEDYPNSEYYETILSLKGNLQNRLALKDYESAKLYMKLGEYKSALIYLFDIFNNYNDLEIIDDVRIAIVFSYILDKNHDLAVDFYNTEMNNFTNASKKIEAVELIESTENGVKTMEYLRLFK